MNKISYVLLFLVIVLAVVLAGGAIYYFSETAKLKNEIADQKTRLENLGSQVLEKEGEIDNLTAQTQDVEAQIEARAEYLTKYNEYIDETIGISFYYPKSWGDIAVHEEPMADPAQSSTSAHTLILKTGNDETQYIFLSAVAAKGPDRGGYWGDEALNIDGNDWVNGYCEGKESCTLFTNKNGITIAKIANLEVALNEATNATASMQYYLYNPNNIFHGIVMSTVALENSGAAFEEVPAGLEEIANTLTFIEK